MDELGALEPKVAALRPLQKRAEAIRTELKSVCTNPKKGARFSGERFTAEISEQEERREILSPEAVYKALGHARFLELAVIPVGALEEALPLQKFEPLVKLRHCGPRKVTIRPITEA